MDQETVMLLKELAGKSFEEKTELLKQWQNDSLISAETAQEILKKLTARKNLKARQLKAIKEAEKDTHAFDALWRKSSTEEIKIALENLQATLRMKRKAYLTDRYFNPELSANEKKALDAALKDIAYQYFSYQVEDILIEVLKYPIKSIKMKGNEFLESLLAQERVSILFWIKLLNRQYVAKRQWRQIVLLADQFVPCGNIILSLLAEWERKGEPGAIEATKALKALL